MRMLTGLIDILRRDCSMTMERPDCRAGETSGGRQITRTQRVLRVHRGFYEYIEGSTLPKRQLSVMQTAPRVLARES